MPFLSSCISYHSSNSQKRTFFSKALREIFKATQQSGFYKSSNRPTFIKPPSWHQKNTASETLQNHEKSPGNSLFYEERRVIGYVDYKMQKLIQAK